MLRRAYETATAVFLGLMTILVTAPAAAQTTREPQKLIVAFGDSLTAGYRLKPTEGFAPQLEAALKAQGRNVRVHNAGVSGDTTAAGRQRLAWVLNAVKTKPDLVILQLGANDMLRGLPPKQTRANLDAMLAELRKRNIPVLLAGMLGGPNLGVRYLDEFNTIYPALARQYGATHYPFFLKGVAFNKPLLLDDGMHPNRAGVGVMVRNILPTVAKALDAPPVRRN
jgi:acyl-CoA thioesterase I